MKMYFFMAALFLVALAGVFKFAPEKETENDEVGQVVLLTNSGDELEGVFLG